MITLGDIIMNSLQQFGIGFVEFLLRFVPAIIIFFLGWLIAAAIGKIISEILKRLKLDKLFEARGWKEAMDKAELKTTISEFVGSLCKWILVIVFLAIAVQILGIEGFSSFLFEEVIPWLPNLLVAVLIFVATVIIADFAEKMVKASINRAKMSHVNLAGVIVRWSIWIFGVFAILSQLGIAKDLLLSLFQGIVALIAIAGGLAFGLGGKEIAAESLRSLKDKLRK